MESTETQPDTTSSEFVPDPGGGDNTDANALMVVAYMLFWALVLGFVALGWRKTRKLETDLDRLEAAISKRGGTDAS